MANAQTYIVRLPFDTLRISADLTQASAPIQLLSDDDEDDRVQCTPYQTADAHHREREMAHLVLDHLGPEYWSHPGQETEDEEGETLYAGRSRHDYIDSIILDIRRQAE